MRAAEDAVSPDGWWRVDAFRAYAAWTRTADFADGLDAVLAEASSRRTAVMCSEAVWWRCHRRVVADVATVLRGVDVQHLMHDGSLRPHPESESAIVVDGGVRWPPAPID